MNSLLIALALTTQIFIPQDRVPCEIQCWAQYKDGIYDTEILKAINVIKMRGAQDAIRASDRILFSFNYRANAPQVDLYFYKSDCKVDVVELGAAVEWDKYDCFRLVILIHKSIVKEYGFKTLSIGIFERGIKNEPTPPTI